MSGCVPIAAEQLLQLIAGAGLAGALLACMLVGFGRWLLDHLDRWIHSTAWHRRAEARAMRYLAARQRQRHRLYRPTPAEMLAEQDAPL